MAPEPALSPRPEVLVRELFSPTIEPVPQAPLTIVLRPRRDCWVSLRIDGESVVRRVMRAGEQETYGGGRRDYPKRRGRRGVSRSRSTSALAGRSEPRAKS